MTTDFLDALNDDATLCERVLFAPDISDDRTEVSISFDSVTAAARAMMLANRCGWTAHANRVKHAPTRGWRLTARRR